LGRGLDAVKRGYSDKWPGGVAWPGFARGGGAGAGAGLGLDVVKRGYSDKWPRAGGDGFGLGMWLSNSGLVYRIIYREKQVLIASPGL
jgi:hypothetical protein